VIMLYTVLRYLEEGKHSTLFLYTAVVSLHFCTKETAFISTAAMLIFLALLFLKDVIQKKWKQELDRNGFILSMIIALVLVGAALGGLAYCQLKMELLLKPPRRSWMESLLRQRVRLYR
jgi:predicted membrane-bound mannosyltransferase